MARTTMDVSTGSGVRPATGSGVRPATGDELDLLVRIEQGPQTTRYLGVTGRAYHERAYADPDQEQIVAEAGTAVVGFVVLAGLRRPDRVVELRRVVVSHRHRGSGHGRRLFRAAVARAYQVHGARQVWLDVKPDNTKGRTLYASEGFVPDGTIPDPVRPDGVLLVMRHTPQPPTTPRQE